MLPTLTSRQQLALGLLLALTMILTRPHTLSSVHHLPGTSWAVFFLAGIFIRRAWPFYAYCGLAAAIDYVAITFGGVSSFCVTPAYAMLLPAFGALWLGGRWYAQRHRDSLATLPRLAVAVVASAFVAELFSSGGFYFLGGRYAEPTLAEFLPRLTNYFPGMLGAMALYVAAAAVAYAAWAATRRPDADGPRTLSPWLRK
ncbi:MAG: hypothetical protein AB1421_14570 [Pseudomonadota bacterium]